MEEVIFEEKTIAATVLWLSTVQYIQLSLAGCVQEGLLRVWLLFVLVILLPDITWRLLSVNTTWVGVVFVSEIFLLGKFREFPVPGFSFAASCVCNVAEIFLSGKLRVFCYREFHSR